MEISIQFLRLCKIRMINNPIKSIPSNILSTRLWCTQCSNKKISYVIIDS